MDIDGCDTTFACVDCCPCSSCVWNSSMILFGAFGRFPTLLSSLFQTKRQNAAGSDSDCARDHSWPLSKFWDGVKSTCSDHINRNLTSILMKEQMARINTFSIITYSSAMFDVSVVLFGPLGGGSIFLIVGFLRGQWWFPNCRMRRPSWTCQITYFWRFFACGVSGSPRDRLVFVFVGVLRPIENCGHSKLSGKMGNGWR